MHIQVESWMSDELKSEIELYNRFVSEHADLAQIEDTLEPADAAKETASQEKWYAAIGTLFRIRIQMDTEMENLKRVQTSVSDKIRTFCGDIMESQPF